MAYKMSVAKLRENAARAGKPEAEVARIVSLGRVDGEWLILQEDVLPAIYGPDWQSKITKPKDQQPVARPNRLQMAKGLGVSVAKWVKSGFALVPESVENMRLQQCFQCQHWNATGNAGLGKCKLCGCSRMKHKLPNERCPDNPPKWTEWTEEKTL